MSRSRFLENRDDEELFDEGREEKVAEDEEEGESYLDEEETLEELDVDDRGHVRRPRRSRVEDEDLFPEE